MPSKHVAPLCGEFSSTETLSWSEKSHLNDPVAFFFGRRVRIGGVAAHFLSKVELLDMARAGAAKPATRTSRGPRPHPIPHLGAANGLIVSLAPHRWAVLTDSRLLA